MEVEVDDTAKQVLNSGPFTFLRCDVIPYSLNGISEDYGIENFEEVDNNGRAYSFRLTQHKDELKHLPLYNDNARMDFINVKAKKVFEEYLKNSC